MSQRPLLFNYATADVANNQKLLCSAIKPHPIVVLRKNPLVTIVNPLPIPGTNYGVNFAAQIVEAKIDFHPGNQSNCLRSLIRLLMFKNWESRCGYVPAFAVLPEM